MCRTGCPTGGHKSWGECARAANLRVAYCGIGGGDATAQRRWDSELAAYRQARKEGMQPDGTTSRHVEKARRLSDEAGAAYGRDFSQASPVEAA